MLPKISDLIVSESFRKRPGMYIGENSISLLKAFLDGIAYAIDVNKIDPKEDLNLEGFNDWVAKKYNYFESTAGWKNIILNENNQDEEKSLKEFFKLYDQFVNEKSA